MLSKERHQTVTGPNAHGVSSSLYEKLNLIRSLSPRKGDYFEAFQRRAVFRLLRNGTVKRLW